MKNKKIIIVTSTYYPNIFPRAFRWQSLAEYWQTKGYSIYIFCETPNGNKKEEVLNGVTIFRSNKNFKDVIIAKPKNKGEDYSKRNTFLKSIWRKVYWPDSSILWYIRNRRGLFNIIARHNINNIVTVSHPFTSHLFGLYIKNIMPNMNWIVDIGDPFSLMQETSLNNRFLYSKLNEKIDERIIKKARIASVTVEETKHLYLKYFPNLVDKIIVIPPLLKMEKVDSKNKDKKRYFDSGKNIINIVYIGGFYPKIREPRILLDFIRRLIEVKPVECKKIKFHFFGKYLPEILKIFNEYKDLDGIVFIRGQVKRAEVLPIMKQADFLLNVANTNSYQLPSKVVDYLVSQKPIINFTTINNDLFFKYFIGYPAFLNTILKIKQEVSHDVIKNFYTFITKEHDCTKVDNFIEQKKVLHSLESVSQQYLAWV